MSGAIIVTVMESREQMDALGPKWDDLLSRADVASPFLTHEWQAAWLDTYGTSHRPFVLVAHDRDTLVGIWPLGLRRRGLFRVLEPLGAGRSDWLDVIVDPDYRQPVMGALAAFLADQRSRWDLIELRDILAESPNLPALGAQCQSGTLSLHCQTRTIAPYLALRGTWESYLASRSGNFRSSLRRHLKKAAEPGALTVTASSSPERATVDAFADVERQSWKAHEGTLKLTTATGRDFYQRFLAALATKGLLKIWTATHEGRVVAYLVLFVHGGKCYYYNGAYDERSSALSPGTVLHASAIEDAFRQGLTEYDFLSGDEPYKARWATAHREIYHVALSNGRLTSMAAWLTLVKLRWIVKMSAALKAWRAESIRIARRIVRRRASA